jgi:hypothetical protein
MRRIFFVTLIAMFVMSACVMVPDGRSVRGVRGRAVVFAPPLPPVVVIDIEPYYYHQGYHYHYDNNRWYYSKSRKGPWKDLPRDRYPKETRFKKKHKDGDRDKGRGRDRDGRYDDRGRGDDDRYDRDRYDYRR